MTSFFLIGGVTSFQSNPSIMIWTHPTKTQIPNFPKVFIGSSEAATKTAEENGAPPSAEDGGTGAG